MLHQRARITITFDANLDPIPGWGSSAEDWIRLAMAQVLLQEHYGTRLISSTWTIKEVEGALDSVAE